MLSPTQNEITPKKQTRKPKSIIHEYFKKRKIGETALFGAVIGVGVAFYIFCAEFLLHNRVSFLQAVTHSIVIILVIFAFFTMAHIAGGKIVKGELNINPWFGWFIAGSMFFFWAGASLVGRFYVGGFGAVGVWGIVLLCAWSINRLIKHKA